MILKRNRDAYVYFAVRLSLYAFFFIFSSISRSSSVRQNFIIFLLSSVPGIDILSSLQSWLSSRVASSLLKREKKKKGRVKSVSEEFDRRASLPRSSLDYDSMQRMLCRRCCCCTQIHCSSVEGRERAPVDRQIFLPRNAGERCCRC